MQTEKQFIMKCCICGRERTEQGWQYHSRSDEKNRIYSHGFCAPCYETEMLKLRMQMTLAVVPLYQ
jgi:hypothetical protein